VGGGGSYDGGYGAFAICITSGTTAGLVNDAASGAVALTNYDCYPQDTRGWVFYTTVGATNASEPALPACWTSTLTANKTIWFKFTATTTQQLVTTNWWCSQVARGAPDNRMAVYSSSNNLSTGAFTLIGCLEDIRNTTSTPSSSLYGFENPSFAGFWTHEDLQTALTVTGLTIGNTYFIRIDAADGIVSVCTEPNTILNDDCATALNAPLNTVMRVNTTGLGPWSNISIPDLGFSCGTVQNMMYYYFDPAFTDLYYINQWSQLCDMSVGSQFIVCNAGLNCATLQQATVGNNTGNIMICSNTTTGNRALSANFTAGQRYYIIWDGGSGDECDFYWQITRSIPAPLPVTLLDFYVGCEKSSVKAVWTTATETNNDYFILERSSDGINFTEGDKVKGAGTTSTPHTYSTYDNEIGKTMYYRIKQVDFNGEFTYSKTASVNCKASRLDVTAIVPVPSDNYIDIYYTLEKDDNMQFMVYDLLGNQVILESARGIKGGNLQRISLINLSGGMYHITVSSSTESFSDKIIKQ